MTFIIICVALIVERFFHWTHLRHWRWFIRYERWFNEKTSHWPSRVALIACLALPLILVGLIDHFIPNLFYGAVKFIFDVVILLYCLGPSNLWLQVYRSLSELSKDRAAGLEYAQSAFGVVATDEPQSFHQAFVRAIFSAASDRIFSVLFWYAIAGPAGAVLYRLVSLSSEQSLFGATQFATQIKNLLDWIPVRIFTFLFALCGHFKNVFAHWKPYLFKGLNENALLLNECGLASLDVVENGRIPEDGTAEKETLDLLDRVFVMGLVLLAVVVLLT